MSRLVITFCFHFCNASSLTLICICDHEGYEQHFIDLFEMLNKTLDLHILKRNWKFWWRFRNAEESAFLWIILQVVRRSRNRFVWLTLWINSDNVGVTAVRITPISYEMDTRRKDIITARLMWRMYSLGTFRNRGPTSLSRMWIK